MDLKQEVPASYHADFLRLLGKQKVEGNARDKDQFYTKSSVARKCFDQFCKTSKNLKGCSGRIYFY